MRRTPNPSTNPGAKPGAKPRLRPLPHPIGVVILAAGKGTRMRSRTPKVAHQVAGRAMLEHVLRAAAGAVSPSPEHDAGNAAGSDTGTEDHSPRYGARYVIVTGHERDAVRASLGWTPPATDLTFVVQEPQLGTGDATRTGLSAFGDRAPETTLVLYGDTPLLRPETLRALVEEHARTEATLTFLTGIADGPTDYGRVLRDAEGHVRGIVEQKHATPDELAIREVNSGIYCFQTPWLASALSQLEPHPNGEYYLTDMVELAVRDGLPVSTVTAPLAETAGVNDRVQLAGAERILRYRILEDLMRSGVTIEDPATTYVEAGVRVGQDTLLRPGTALRGATVIGERCEIGPNSLIRDSRIGDECRVYASWVEEATMERGSRVGPMSHLRPRAHLKPGAHIGNFGEVKNATIGEDVRMHHFSYVGDATIGARTNVAAGVITCNFEPDGKKYRTEVGEDVFIGSDTMLIAPVTLGDGAQTGASAVVKRDVPPGGVAVGMPARVIKHTNKHTNKHREVQRHSGTENAARNSAEGSADGQPAAHPPEHPERADTPGTETSPRTGAAPVTHAPRQRPGRGSSKRSGE